MQAFQGPFYCTNLLWTGVVIALLDLCLILINSELFDLNIPSPNSIGIFCWHQSLIILTIVANASHLFLFEQVAINTCNVSAHSSQWKSTILIKTIWLKVPLFSSATFFWTRPLGFICRNFDLSTTNSVMHRNSHLDRDGRNTVITLDLEALAHRSIH